MICISALMSVSLVLGIISSFLMQTVAMSQMATQFDTYRQTMNLEKSIENGLKAAAYEALEPKLEALSSNFSMLSSAYMKNIDANLSATSTLDFGSLSFFPDNIYTYTLGEGRRWRDHLPTLKWINETIEVKKEEDIFKYQLSVNLFPITNIDVVAYGLPITGKIPEDIPHRLKSSEYSNLNILTLTYENSFKTAASGNELSFLHLEALSQCWNLYEYIFSPEYQSKLVRAAGDYALDLTKQQKPKDGVNYDFETKSLDIDLSKIKSRTLAIIDPLGQGNIRIHDSGGNPDCLIINIWSRNRALKPKLSFSNSNTRPLIIYVPNASLDLKGHTLSGALFLGKDCECQGPGNISGHCSFYANNPDPLESIQIRSDQGIKKMISSQGPVACEVKIHPVH